VAVAELQPRPHVVPQHPHRLPQRRPQHPLLALPQPAHPLDVGPEEQAVVEDADVAVLLHLPHLLPSTRNWTRFSPTADTACIR
jgi:hypothetical protein